jgi:LacI family transcriptional regulator
LETVWSVLPSLEADGIIMRDGRHLDEFIKLGIPAVVIGHKHQEVAGLVNVVTNSPQVGRLGAEHLLQCGFKHFAFVGVAQPRNEAASWSQARCEHFVRRLRGAGHETHTFELPAGRDWAGERRALAEWLVALPKPVGLMACNDDCGVQVMEACKAVGLAVPDRVGVLGADNDEIVCGLSNPAMSSVAINFERAGFEAAEALDQLMRGNCKVPEKISVPATHVVTRCSTDIVAVAEPALARALRFIRDHARNAIGVNDVARSAGLSRRALERRFRSEIGSTILEHIRKARTEQICRMLVETSLPVGEIAESLGFEDVQHFSRYFRSAREVTPLAYRKSFGKQPGFGRSQHGISFSPSGVVHYAIANQ